MDGQTPKTRLEAEMLWKLLLKAAAATRLAGGSTPDGFLIDFLKEVSLNQSVQELRPFASF